MSEAVKGKVKDLDKPALILVSLAFQFHTVDMATSKFRQITLTTLVRAHN